MTAYRTRGSSADRIYHCAGAIGHDGPAINEHSPEAKTGQVAHYGLALLVLGIDFDIDALCEQAPDPETARVAIFTGIKIWKDVNPLFPGALTEQRLEGRVTQGTCDVISLTYDNDELVKMAIGDWKLADSGNGHPYQLRAYAAAAMDQFGSPSSGYVNLGEFWLLDGERNLEQVSVDEVAEFVAHMERQHAQAGKQFAAGPWCRFCPARMECPARDSYVRSAAHALAEFSPGVVSREALATLWDRAALLKKALLEYDKAVAIALDDGPLDIGGGRRVEWHDSEQLVFCKPTEALDFLRDTVDCDKVCRISKHAVEREIRSRAPKGQGAGRIRVALGQLDAHGLTTTKTVRKRKVVKS